MGDQVLIAEREDRWKKNKAEMEREAEGRHGEGRKADIKEE